MTLAEVLPAVRQLTAPEKLKLIRLLAEDLDRDEANSPFERGKVYNLPTPYDSYGAAQALADALATGHETEA
jgi:hypothetical protein